MEEFIPGKQYGQPYTTYIWVCMNLATRTFEKCDLSAAQQVLITLQNVIREKGLNREVMVLSSSCIMGCQPNGVTIAIAKQKHPQNMLLNFYNNITPEDIPDLINKL